MVGGLEFVQVLHSNNNHWLTISTIGCSYSTVKVYDSLYMKMPRSTIKQVCSLLASSEPSITLQFEPSDRQLNGNDCGLFALAFCTALCSGKDPQGLQFDQKIMRQHLLKCLTQEHMEPFPCKGIICKQQLRRPTKFPFTALVVPKKQATWWNAKGAENGTIKNVLACQSMFGRKEAFHGSADTAVNTTHVCIDILHRPP